MPAMAPLKFDIQARDGAARSGTVHTAHGSFETPTFVAVGTKATIKSLTPEQISAAGIDVVLGNTYHLYLQPGQGVVKAHGGFAPMMGWKGPSITDSGGFQVFSLGAAYGSGISKILKQANQPEELSLPESNEQITRLASIDHDGVMFRSHIDGSAHYFTPEKSIEIQHDLGADIFFAFDECTSPTESFAYQREALDRTHRWAKRSLEYHRNSSQAKKQAIFGIVQGGREQVLREESAKIIGTMGFDGIGIGGSFAKDDIHTAVEWVTALVPAELPRHLLGIGEPEDLCAGVLRGIDMFDCVAPTRMARNGGAYTSEGKINLRNAQYQTHFAPINAGCGCYTCKNFTAAYVAHLFRADEMLAATLTTVHNLYFISDLMRNLRQAIRDNRVQDAVDAFLKKYRK